MSKSSFELNFLVLHVNREGIHPLAYKLQAVQDFPWPTTHRKLREFLGIISFVSSLVVQLLVTLKPFNALLAATKRNTTILAWDNDVTTTAFADIKNSLANATLNKHPAPTCIMTNVSELVVGAVLQQCIEDQWCPFAYISKAMKPSESHYSTFDRKLLAIYLAIKHFGHFIEGRSFHVLTDHKPLTCALAACSDCYSSHA